MQSKNSSYLLWFEEIGIDDIPIVGGKNASLGEMYQQLKPRGVGLVDGFALTATAYRYFIAVNQLEQTISTLLSDCDPSDLTTLQERGAQIRKQILASRLPDSICDAIATAYEKLGSPDVAVRSSATAEDLPGSSFAGQQETFLNVQGIASLLKASLRCYASLFTDRAISYRIHQGFDHSQVALSIGIQPMVRSDLASSGVLFTIDTETGFPDVVQIESSWGLGESIVQGTVNPDAFTIFKPTLKQGFRSILRKVLGSKESKLIYNADHTKTVVTSDAERQQLSLTDDEALTLARWGCLIEEHYQRPMDIEWAKDGKTGALYILQARPETVQTEKSHDTLEIYHLEKSDTPIVSGRSVGEKIGSGAVRIIHNIADAAQLQEGEVLVTEKTDPDWEPIMKKASAIVTNKGGRTCHAAIVSRELGLPAVVGAENATSLLAQEKDITVSCAEGDEGHIYGGLIPYHVETIKLGEIDRPNTQIMMNIADPHDAFHHSFIPNDGVGLAREEFIISAFIGIHPLALVNYASIDEAIRKQIDKKTIGYSNKSQFFIDQLAQGVAMIAAAFYPKDVIVRLSDYKTNEYAHLIGGSLFEPTEENPMLGFRGASRYYDSRYKEGFALECLALKKAREEIGLSNIKIMVPFCRTVEEGRRVLNEMALHGLSRGDNGLEVYVMCEIPSNVVLAEEFAELFDGFSIGSNDLTQLTLGVDRDSAIITHLFDERNAAVTKMISEVIAVAKRKGKKVGICGQAPSDYPEFTRFLIEQGIDSISLTPDAVIKTTILVVEQEKTLFKKKHRNTNKNQRPS